MIFYTILLWYLTTKLEKSLPMIFYTIFCDTATKLDKSLSI